MRKRTKAIILFYLMIIAFFFLTPRLKILTNIKRTAYCSNNSFLINNLENVHGPRGRSKT